MAHDAAVEIEQLEEEYEKLQQRINFAIECCILVKNSLSKSSKAYIKSNALEDWISALIRMLEGDNKDE